MRRKLNLLKRAKFSRALNKKLDTTLLKLHHIEALLSSLSFLPQIWWKLHEVEDLNFSIEEKNNWMNRVLNEYCRESDPLQQIVNILHQRDVDNAKADMDWRYGHPAPHRS